MISVSGSAGKRRGDAARRRVLSTKFAPETNSQQAQGRTVFLKLGNGMASISDCTACQSPEDRQP